MSVLEVGGQVRRRLIPPIFSFWQHVIYHVYQYNRKVLVGSGNHDQMAAVELVELS
jgi:hypothetical protein